MKLPHFYVRMKHLFLVSIIILLLETLLFLTYNFIYLRVPPGFYLVTRNFQVDIIIFSMNLCFLLVIWVAFLFYYRYSLPKEILNLIIGAENENSPDKAVQKLQQEVKNYYEQKNIMITALAHDIKTPLTEAILRLALMDDQISAEQILKKLEEVNQIVNSSLEYAKEPERLKRVKADVISLIESVAEEYTRSGFPVRFHSAVFSFTIEIELQLFKRMLTNLIENARKYATECMITITQPQKRMLEIICEDDGPGVPEAYLHLLSIPYFRVDQSRSSETGGTGLGLAIVKKICELHGAKIAFSNRQGGGFLVKILLEKPKGPERKEKRV